MIWLISLLSPRHLSCYWPLEWSHPIRRNLAFPCHAFFWTLTNAFRLCAGRGRLRLIDRCIWRVSCYMDTPYLVRKHKLKADWRTRDGFPVWARWDPWSAWLSSCALGLSWHILASLGGHQPVRSITVLISPLHNYLTFLRHREIPFNCMLTQCNAADVDHATRIPPYHDSWLVVETKSLGGLRAGGSDLQPTNSPWAYF